MSSAKKRIIIIEGVDASGKTKLSQHIQQDIANGKCHVLHSNYNKNISQENHRRQHTLLTKFALSNFKSTNYTGNNIIIMDRCYVSDMTYGQIGYGSRGTMEEKFKHLSHLFKLLTSNKNVEVIFIYCKPYKSAFDDTKESREELLNKFENNKMQKIYDSVCLSPEFQQLINIYDVKFYMYNFETDSQYKMLDNNCFPEITKKYKTQISVNQCVSCGRNIPEGDHVCKLCREGK